MIIHKKPAAKSASKKGSAQSKTISKPVVVKAKTPKSHAFARVMVDPKTGILVSISALPSNPRLVKTSDAAVFIHTLIGNVGYQEQVEFENITRATEYVADFSQVQSNRFANSAIEYQKLNDPELVTMQAVAVSGVDGSNTEAKEKK